MDQLSLENIVSIIAALLSPGLLMIWWRIKEKQLNSHLTNLQSLKLHTKLSASLNDPEFKKFNDEFLKDEIFFLRSRMRLQGKLREVFVKRYEELTEHFTPGQLYWMRSYFKLTDRELDIRSGKELREENFFMFGYMGFISLITSGMFITVILLMDGPVWINLGLGIGAGLLWLPIINQIFTLQMISKIKRYLANGTLQVGRKTDTSRSSKKKKG